METYTAAPMAAVALKQHMYLAETMSKGRDAFGKACRSSRSTGENNTQTPGA